jgi:hypothetical protein
VETQHLGGGGDCLAGGLPVEGLGRGCGRPYAGGRPGSTLGLPTVCLAGLPQGSPRAGLEPEVAKKSLHSGLPGRPRAGVSNEGNGAFAPPLREAKAPLRT